MNFASFEAWRAGKASDLAADDPLLNCPKCDGEGVIYDECLECGHEAEADCGTCDASGKVRFNDLPQKEWTKLFTHDAYFKELVDVSRDVSGFYGTDFFELMCDAVKVSDRASVHAYA
ncbi:hypothetical protein [Zhongshania sp.]|uniref:hypothetical protein n=1 Tax=Zhongshania sp. TaxID=1971902 RepID=UPI002A840582|nr:hypothetical protein [Zhongshania sp.]